MRTNNTYLGPITPAVSDQASRVEAVPVADQVRGGDVDDPGVVRGSVAAVAMTGGVAGGLATQKTTAQIREGGARTFAAGSGGMPLDVGGSARAAPDGGDSAPVNAGGDLTVRRRR